MSLNKGFIMSSVFRIVLAVSAVVFFAGGIAFRSVMPLSMGLIALAAAFVAILLRNLQRDTDDDKPE